MDLVVRHVHGAHRWIESGAGGRHCAGDAEVGVAGCDRLGGFEPAVSGSGFHRGFDRVDDVAGRTRIFEGGHDDLLQLVGVHRIGLVGERRSIQHRFDGAVDLDLKGADRRHRLPGQIPASRAGALLADEVADSGRTDTISHIIPGDIHHPHVAR